jgi:predicted ATPase
MAETKPAFNTFGELLKHLRQRAQLTQDEFGLAVGYSRAHIARLESNQRLPDAGAVKARFFMPLDLKPDSNEAMLLVKLAQSAHATPTSLAEEHESAPPSIPNNLSCELTSFIGRENALSELERLLPSARLLTLTGTGGTGKTRLALKLAERVIRGYSDGVWLVELAPLSDPAQVPSAVLSALSLRELTDKSPTASLIAHLQDKRMLLILDNCEHVIEACAQLADAMLRGCKHLCVLCTSREALGIAGELAWRVPSLVMPDAQKTDLAALQQIEAIALFIERAAFAAPHFKLTADNAPAMVHICKRLDGIPLAIELAAARVKALTPVEIAARLDDRFRLLAGGSRTALPRQQTLQATVDWSYRLLSEPERLLLSRLSVFTGGWTLAAAEHVCAGEGIERADVFDLLSRLVDKSLVAVDNAGIETRYFLLETIRQYAIEKLNAGDEARLMRDRHLDYFLVLRDQVFDELWGIYAQNQAVRVKQLAPDLNNIRQAIRWAIDAHQTAFAYRLVEGFCWIFFSRSSINELIDWLSLIASDIALDIHVRANALGFIAETYDLLGRHNDAHVAAKQLLDLGNSQNELEILYLGVLASVWNALSRRQISEARSCIDRYKSTLANTAYEPRIGLIVNMTGAEALLALLEGDFKKAIEGNSIVYTHLSNNGHKLLSTSIARRLGYAHLLSGNVSRASSFFRESMLDNHALGDLLALSACLYAFGTMAVVTGDMPRAACLFAVATKTMKFTGRPTMSWDAQLYESSLAAVQSHLDQSELAAMWAKGEAMTLEQAMAYALAE